MDDVKCSRCDFIYKRIYPDSDQALGCACYFYLHENEKIDNNNNGGELMHAFDSMQIDAYYNDV